VSARRSFVVFADDWGRHPSSCQHLFRRIAPRHRVIWVNTIGTRTPSLAPADLMRAAGKLREWTLGAGRGPGAGENGGASAGPGAGGSEEIPVRVLRPVMTPFDRWRPFRRLNAQLLVRAVRDALEPGEAPVLVTTIPNAAGVVGEIGESASVYYCVDEFSEWPGADRGAMLEMERDLLGKVDLVVATADTLFEAKSAAHPRVRLLKHGVDWERFRSGGGRVPESLSGLSRPIVGFTGLVDERLDVPLLDDLAASRPEVSFVFVGPRQLTEGALDRRPNVRFLPPVRYEDVPAVLGTLDAAILPYLENALTERINPLKLREFLASGIPIVATPLPEVRPYAGWLYAARGTDEWLRGLDGALSEGRTRAAARSESVREEGWDRKAEEFLRLCAEAVRPAGPAGGGA
jgi:glycosyltransferase involved in cell wall biosynthesis